MDNIQAPWVGDDDYGKREIISREDRDWHLQDERHDALLEESHDEEE